MPIAFREIGCGTKAAPPLISRPRLFRSDVHRVKLCKDGAARAAAPEGAVQSWTCAWGAGGIRAVVVRGRAGGAMPPSAAARASEIENVFIGKALHPPKAFGQGRPGREARLSPVPRPRAGWQSSRGSSARA